MPIKKDSLYKVNLLIFFLLLILPTLIFCLQSGNFALLFKWPQVLYQLGKITALLGLSTFAFSLLLASRFYWLDYFFCGLPKTINIHRWLGVVSFTLILMHPILLGLNLLILSRAAAFSIFSHWSDKYYVFGYVALILFMFLVLMTFFWRLKYERLKSLHSLLCVPLLLGGLHALYIDSDIKRQAWMFWYYFILLTLAVSLYLARIFLIKLKIKAKPHTISQVQLVAKSAIKITLRPKNLPLKIQPGQFVFLSLPSIKAGEEHPFSVSSIAPSGEFSIIAKTDGDYTSRLTASKIGDQAFVDGPYGVFGQSGAKRPQVWIAGGIGVTPFLSLAEDLARHSAQQTVDLFYTAAVAEDFVELKTLEDWAANNTQFHLHIHESKSAGRLGVDKIKTAATNFGDSVFFLCGPKPMVQSLLVQLEQSGVDANSIYIEAFKLL